MARPISDEELQLKKRARRRLVGAIVLVSAVAVILPMVLDSEPKALNQKVDIQIPTNERADKAKPAAAAPTTEAVTPQASAETGSVPATAVSEVAPSQTQREPVHSGSNAAVGQTSGSGSKRRRIIWKILRMVRTMVGFRCSWLSPLKQE